MNVGKHHRICQSNELVQHQNSFNRMNSFRHKVLISMVSLLHATDKKRLSNFISFINTIPHNHSHVSLFLIKLNPEIHFFSLCPSSHIVLIVDNTSFPFNFLPNKPLPKYCFSYRVHQYRYTTMYTIHTLLLHANMIDL